MTQDNSPDFPFDSHYIEVLGSQIHYLDEGNGNPIVFLHSIPSSSDSWRHIIPYLSSLGRCIAPDFKGAYSISDHIRYIEKFIEVLGLKNITFVMHGVGSIIGFEYAMRHEKNCKALAFYEAFLRPMHGEAVSLLFQEQQEGAEKPLVEYLQTLPNIDEMITHYSQKLTESYLPKLLLYSIPGFITTIATVMWAKENLPNLEIAEVGEDLHFAQESNPTLMGETISIWLQGVEQI